MEGLRPVGLTSSLRSYDFFLSTHEEALKLSPYLFDSRIQTNDEVQDVQPLAAVHPTETVDKDVDADSAGSDSEDSGSEDEHAEPVIHQSRSPSCDGGSDDNTSPTEGFLQREVEDGDDDGSGGEEPEEEDFFDIVINSTQAES